ncbi:MAG: sigma-70 family RNA polymerase sigma factor [Burkholderiales bacterium]|nr:sigma-70 family RNA polymerase sigma factor [Burkholderiales bacterium]OJX06596.1 MAG: RNA polymerase subunit sigma [Burkholderiales bacterium 70-64]
MPAAQLALPRDALRQQVQLLYRHHHGWLHGWLRRKLGCTQNAADLAHDTFMRLLAREEPVAIEEPRAFLTTVAQRVLSNHRRRERIERAYLEVLAQVPEALAPSLEERAILLETLVEIDRLLGGLPPLVKRAFLHAQLDGMTHAGIAAELGISVTTVKRYLVRAGTQCYFALAAD